VKCLYALQASPRIQTDECFVRDISEKLDRGNVTESIFDAVQAKVCVLLLLCFVASVKCVTRVWFITYSSELVAD